MTNRNQPRIPDFFNRRMLTRSLLAAALALPIAISACGRKEEPPPPPPPPPPPVYVPDPVDVEALRQELGVDARVQIARNVEVMDRDIAEGMLRFADTWAKGDASSLRSMLDRRDRPILDDLRARGDWDSELEKMEAVRIVYMAEDGIDRGAEHVDIDRLFSERDYRIETFQRLDVAALVASTQAVMGTIEGLEPGQLERMWTRMELGEDFDETWENFLQTPAGVKLKEKMGEIIAAAGGQNIDGPVFTMALQQPGVSYVLAWNMKNSGGGWSYASVHTVDTVRKRASEWDGRAGLAGIILADATVEAEDGPESQDDPESPTEAAPGSPGINTPAGPLTVPGSS